MCVYIYIYIVQDDLLRIGLGPRSDHNLSYEEFTRLAETRLAQKSFNYI